MESFSVGTIDLSMKHHETNLPLTANVYSIPGVNNDQPMSIGQLVMAICLARANDLEGKIIDLMQEMDQTSADLERLTEIELNLMHGLELNQEDHAYLEEILGMSFRRSNADIAKELDSLGTNDFSALLLSVRLRSNPDYQLTAEDLAILANNNISLYLPADDIAKEIETKMDSMNSFSQEKMIELQSQTNKRDQAYDMIANVLKSLNNVLIGTVNNL